MNIPTDSLDTVKLRRDNPGYRWRFLLLPLLLVVAVLLVYWPVQKFEFIDYDDNIYIIENRHLQNASPQRFVKWAFTDTSVGHWHPLTWFSHRLDWQCFRAWAGGHHGSNVLFHIINSLLLYGILLKMTGEGRKSALVAFIFAVHPLNVESVAWVAERKNVLSVCWAFLSVAAYLAYVKKPSGLRYSALCLFFLAGLMTKPILVIFPLLLLLLDYWPLNRIASPGGGNHGNGKRFSGLIYEKMPLFMLSMVSVTITAMAAQNGGAIRSLSEMSMDSRLMNAFLSYALYIKRLALPADLAFYYPYPSSFLLVEVVASMGLLTAITAWVVYKRQDYPYLLMGWLWFVITLLPVIGIIQVGFQAMADRYAYLSMIGLLIMVAWGSADALSKAPSKKIILVALSCLVIITFMIMSHRQLQTWRNSFTLAERALTVTKDNHMAHLLMGNILYDRRDMAGASSHYLLALRGRPNASEIHNNLGNVSFSQGKFSEALSSYERSLQLNPRNAKALNNIGVILLMQGQAEGAAASFREALRIDPTYPAPRRYLFKMGIVPDEDKQD